MKRLDELGISPTPWAVNGHWVDFKDGRALPFGDTSEGCANARLFAAAPDLYECLCEAIEHVCYTSPVNFEKWRMALMKARGDAAK